MGWESFGVVRFNLWTPLQGQIRTAKLKSAYNSLIIGLKFAGYVPHYKILTGNIFGLILKNKMAATGVSLPLMKRVILPLLLVLEVWDGKPTCRKSWAGNLLVWSDLTFGPLLQGQIRTAKLKSAYNSLIMSTPLGVDILFLLFPPSGVPLGFQTF